MLLIQKIFQIPSDIQGFLSVIKSWSDTASPSLSAAEPGVGSGSDGLCSNTTKGQISLSILY